MPSLGARAAFGALKARAHAHSALTLGKGENGRGLFARAAVSQGETLLRVEEPLWGPFSSARARESAPASLLAAIDELDGLRSASRREYKKTPAPRTPGIAHECVCLAPCAGASRAGGRLAGATLATLSLAAHAASPEHAAYFALLAEGDLDTPARQPAHLVFSTFVCVWIVAPGGIGRACFVGSRIRMTREAGCVSRV